MEEVAQTKLSAKDICLAFKSWAQENNLITGHLPVEITHLLQDNPDIYDQLCISSQSEMILRNRNIIDAFFNEAQRKIVVLTAKKITQKDIKELPKFANEDINYEFIHGSIATANTPNTGITNYGYHVTGSGAYTCGSSIHPAKVIGCGTIGCLVKDSNGVIYGLTNNHVSGMCNYANEGEKIIAPGHLDIASTGIDPFTIGYHHKSAPMTPGVPDNVDVSLNIDAALLKISDPKRVSSMQGFHFDTPMKVGKIEPGQVIKKVGRTTGLTKGKVIGQSANPMPVQGTVPNIGAQVTFYDSIYLARGLSDDRPFSITGDSGSLVIADIDGEECAVGLVFAGDNQGNSHILPLDKVLEYFKVDIISGHNV